MTRKPQNKKEKHILFRKIDLDKIPEITKK